MTTTKENLFRESSVVQLNWSFESSGVLFWKNSLTFSILSLGRDIRAPYTIRDHHVLGMVGLRQDARMLQKQPRTWNQKAELAAFEISLHALPAHLLRTARETITCYPSLNAKDCFSLKAIGDARLIPNSKDPSSLNTYGLAKSLIKSEPNHTLKHRTLVSFEKKATFSEWTLNLQFWTPSFVQLVDRLSTPDKNFFLPDESRPRYKRFLVSIKSATNFRSLLVCHEVYL